ncbi:FAD binding domain-containing protein [Aspergillus sp. HF37]|nr:FAD binding domain-containing protein [Aspergillus sp. HF37]
MSNQYPDASVLVVGAGLAGLTTAVALGIYGIPTTVVERRPGVLPHPRADGFTPRTVEILRALGFPNTVIPEADPGFKLRRARVESLTGLWFEEVVWSQADEQQTVPAAEYSPYRGATTPQDVLEPVLLNRATALGVDFRLGHELVSFSQTGEGITAEIRGPFGQFVELRASYLVAADGHRSIIRDRLGIERSGYGQVNSISSLMFRAPSLDPYLRKGVTQFAIDQPDLKGFLIAYQDGRLVLHLPSQLAVNDEVHQSLAFKAIGTPDVDMEILGSSRWDMSALISEKFSSGRVFLVGDAAHSLPPNRGGYGANTGIADAHNLAWKLAHVLSGISSTALLDTYDAERRPVALLRHDQIFARTDYRTLQRDRGPDSGAGRTVIEDSAMEFGELYRSSGIVGASHCLPPAQRPDQWAGQPGTRAPHILIQRDGRIISSIDLFRGSWMFLARNPRWVNLLDQARSVIPFDALFVELVDPEHESLSFEKAFGVSSYGASLVRPDGYVAWRSSSMPGDVDCLISALKKVLCVS